MGLIDSIKEKFGIGGSGGSDPDMSIANEYREIQPEEIRDESQVEIIPHNEGKLKPMDTDSRERYYAGQAISNRIRKKDERKYLQEQENKEKMERSSVYPNYGGHSVASMAGEVVSSAGRAAGRGVSRGVGKVGRRVSELGSEYVAEPIREVGSRILDTREERQKRLIDNRRRQFAKETIGMGSQEKEAYKEERFTQRREAAIEKAKKEVPIAETAEERRKRVLKEKAEEREIGYAYRKARASAAGTASIKGVKSKKGTKKKGSQEGQGTVAPQNPMMGMGGLVPHGFLPPSPGSGAPGFSGGGSPGFRPNMNLRPIGFEPQAPQPQPAPQPERSSKSEQHRQQVQTETERWKREQQQQYFQQNVYNPQPMPMPSHNGTRNQPQREAPPRPQFIDMFAGHQPTNNNGNGSKQQPQSRMKNLFERDDQPMNTKIGKHEPHPMSQLSGELLGIGSFGNGKAKGNGKKSNRSNIPPWEL